MTPNARPAIISEETFQAVQELLATKSKMLAAERSYLLKYKIKCGSCGHALKYDDGVGYPLYRCHHTLSDPGADCHKFRIIVKEVDEAVLAVIKKQAEVILATAKLNQLAPKSDTGRELADYEKRIAQYSEQRQRYYESFIMGEIGRIEYLELKDECSTEIEKLSKTLATAKAEAKSKEVGKITLDLAKQTVDKTIPHKELDF